MRGAPRTLEVLRGKLLDQSWIVWLATEDIQVNRVAGIGKMGRDQRGLDELGH